MESKQHRVLSNSWIAIGILIVVITLATLIALRQLRQQSAPEFEKP
jgi:formate-dependent nitrite reductase membrane component NrfD